MTKEIIDREFTVSFHDEQSPKTRRETCAGAEAALHSYPAPRDYDRQCRWSGLRIQRVSRRWAKKLSKLLLSRNELFPYAIQPKSNNFLDAGSFQPADLPKSSEIKATVEGQTSVAPDDVVFTCKNATDRWVDVLLWHYPPEKNAGLGLVFPVQQIKGCPIEPNQEGYFDDFALTPGYFLIFVSWHGREAMLVAHANLYASKTPTLTLRKFGDGDVGVKGFLDL